MGNILWARMIQRVSYYFGAITSTCCNAMVDTLSADFVIKFPELLAQFGIDLVDQVVAQNCFQASLALRTIKIHNELRLKLPDPS